MASGNVYKVKNLVHDQVLARVSELAELFLSFSPRAVAKHRRHDGGEARAHCLH